MGNNSRGLWIPIHVLESKLSLLEMCIISDILSITSNGSEYFKTNQVLANTFNVSIRTINTSMRKLTDLGLIKSHITYPYGNLKKRRVISYRSNDFFEKDS